MPTLKIDNREIEVAAGTKVIEAAERLGIIIPRFCFHPALGSAGACRVCAVAFLEGPIKGVQMSCMVSVMDGMVVSTTDREAVDFRRHVIEWLMLNHPHDCPVCDEGGHCLLQDLTVAGGHGLRRYQGTKRTHQDQYLGPLVKHEMNRCIQCYRCSRYYQEYAGGRDLGVMGIGTRVYFGRSKPGRLESPFAGNLIDICPTGVYTDKPSRFYGRRWDFQRAPSVCLHCSLGCNLVVSARYREVVRHEARENLDVNGHFICDRGRYGYPYVNAVQRPRRAMAKGEAISVAEALAVAGQRLQEFSNQAGPQSVAVVASARSSLETLATLKALCRERSWTGPLLQSQGCKIENLNAVAGHLSDDLAVSMGAVSVADIVVVIGADPVNEAPMLALSLRQAWRQGGHVTVIDPRPVGMPLSFDHWAIHPLQLRQVIRRLIEAVTEAGALPDAAPGKDGGTGDSDSLSQSIRSLAGKLLQARRAVIVCGTDITTRQEIGLVAELTNALRQADTEAKLFFVLDGPNAFAAGLLMDPSSRMETILEDIEAARVKALVVVENDLWADCCHRRRLNRALDHLDLLIVLDHIASPLAERADIFLPTQTVYETGGRYVNQEGRIQWCRPVFAGGEPIALTGGLDHPPRVFEKAIAGGSPRPAWRLAAHLMGAGDQTDVSREKEFPAEVMVKADVGWAERRSGRISFKDARLAVAFPEATDELDTDAISGDAIALLVVDWIFGTESLSRYSQPLAEVTPRAKAAIHPQTAERLGLGQNGDIAISTAEGRLVLPFKRDDRMAPGVVVVPRHHALEWQELGGTRLILESGRITKMKDGQ